MLPAARHRDQALCFTNLFILYLLSCTALDAEKLRPEADCAERDLEGRCIPKHRLHHLTHRHKYEGHDVNAVEHLALLHVGGPGAETLSSEATQTIADQTIEAYVKHHLWAHTANNRRFRRFLAGSSLLASTTAGAHPKLVEWYYTQTDVLLDQPKTFLTEVGERGRWITRDQDKKWAEAHKNHTRDVLDTQFWVEIHRNYTRQMLDSQEVDLLLYGDSTFESIIGVRLGRLVKRAEQIPAVWDSYRSGQDKKVLAITGDTTVDLMWRLLNGAMPVTSHVKQVILQIGSNNLLGQWFQLPEDPRMRPAAVAASIISICNLIRATWPDTHLLLAGVLVGGIRGDWPGETRSHRLPNRYSSAAASINLRLMDWVRAQQDHLISFVDCSGLYVIPDKEVPGGLTISKAIMNDTLHPNGHGFSMLLNDCFEPALRGEIDTTMFPSVVWND